MPQWFRDRTADQTKYPDERWRAEARQEIQPLLLRYDHHVVRIAGRPALLLTYHWHALQQNNARGVEALPFDVSFTYAPGHPSAPAEVQVIVEQLTFTPLDGPTSPSERHPRTHRE